ncbi:MAG: hypothetical protein M3O26_10975 [Pseudomonadota bacterium]|nr:hypothetical protein [Pseudomonadota bacterium]
MKNVDSTYMVIGALWLVIGMVVGVVMGASHNYQFMPVHAHIGLVGFACHSIFGMAHRNWPTMRASSVASYQFWIFVLATPITLIGLVFTLRGGPELPTIFGSLGLVLGAALFCYIIWRARNAN